MVETRRTRGRAMWTLVAALSLVVLATTGLEAGPAVAEQRVFPWLAVPVILFMGFCLYVMFKTEPPYEEIEDLEGHADDEGHDVNRDGAEAGT